jgi:DNA helicase HerA-like ATPase
MGTQKPFGEFIGTIVGQTSSDWRSLKLVVTFEERDKKPSVGDFLLVEDVQRLLVCRVEDERYDSYSAATVERERALVEAHVRRVRGLEKELTQEEKRALFYFAYTLVVLGELKVPEGKKQEEVVTVYRSLPALTARCRYPKKSEYKVILSSGLEGNKDLVEIGAFAIGDAYDNELKVLTAPERFEERRTAIFGRTGYGKSNLAKTVVATISATSNVGLLILDMNGEYAFAGKGSKGLADQAVIADKVVVYTRRKPERLRKQYPRATVIPLVFNAGAMFPSEVKTLLAAGAEATRATFRQVSYDSWQRFMREYDQAKEKEKSESTEEREEARRKVDEAIDRLCENMGLRSENEMQRSAISWRLKSALTLHDSTAGRLNDEILGFLLSGVTVVLDFSTMDTKWAETIAAFVLNRVFRFAEEQYTESDEKCPIIAVFEEAQNTLGNKAVEKEDSSIFVRWAKEGRKYGLGLVYITQQPGAIADEIVSQTDNFFVMHLLSDHDINALVKANKHFGSAVAGFLQNEALVGHAYVYSAPHQPFVFPAKLQDFNERDFTSMAEGRKTLDTKIVAQVQKLPAKLKSVTRYSADTKLVTNFARLGYLVGEVVGLEHPLVKESDKPDQQTGKKNPQADFVLTRAVMRMLAARYKIGGYEERNVKPDEGAEISYAWIWDKETCEKMGWTTPEKEPVFDGF